MGKSLHYSIIPFYKKNIFQQNNKVISMDEILNKNYYIYKIQRTGGLADFKVVFSDAYVFTENDYYEMVNENILEKGDFILIARPEGRDSVSLERIYNDGYYIGHTHFLVKYLNNNIDYINSCVEKQIEEIKQNKTH